MKSKSQERILILDFGSQYTQLIARRIRELGVFCEIAPFNQDMSSYGDKNLKGVVLSGGPASVFDKNAPFCKKGIFEMGVPVLGICYGLQLIAKIFEGKLEKAKNREYGRAVLKIDYADMLLKDVKNSSVVWMSHGDNVIRVPKGYKILAHTEDIPYAAMANLKQRIFGLQFHPEVAHTQEGKKILKNFLFTICGCKGTWTPASFINSQIKEIKKKVGKDKVLCGLSGGVDSSVCAVLINRAIGKQLNCIFVNNGLLREGEAGEVVETFKKLKMNLTFVDAKDKFLSALKGITDPEEKRRRIGKLFIQVFEVQAKKIGKTKFLAQGTLYPDVIESTSSRGPSATIKSHHNVGGLPAKMKLKLIEPLRELFKDEVREIGRKLDLPEKIIGRHPFPGPGLAVRVLGEVTEGRLSILRKADRIFIQNLKESGFYNRVWQAFCVLLPIQTVGVMGDERTYENVVALRAVTSLDGMTADWARLPYHLVEKISNQIINQVKGVNRVAYDVSSKPPSTIEWE